MAKISMFYLSENVSFMRASLGKESKPVVFLLLQPKGFMHFCELGLQKENVLGFIGKQKLCLLDEGSPVLEAFCTQAEATSLEDLFNQIDPEAAPYMVDVPKGLADKLGMRSQTILRSDEDEISQEVALEFINERADWHDYEEQIVSAYAWVILADGSVQLLLALAALNEDGLKALKKSLLQSSTQAVRVAQSLTVQQPFYYFSNVGDEQAMSGMCTLASSFGLTIEPLDSI